MPIPEIISFYFFKYETIDTHARAFLTLIILAIAGVNILENKEMVFKKWVKII